MRRSNFTRFSLCIAADGLAAHVAAPFFAVYLLDRLGYGYLEYALVTFGGAPTGMVASPWWGRVGDRAGNHAVLRWTTVGVAVLPLLWLVHPHPVRMVAAAFWRYVREVCAAPSARLRGLTLDLARQRLTGVVEILAGVQPLRFGSASYRWSGAHRRRI